MKFVSALSDAQRASLEHVYRHGSAHRQRQRAQAVLLSAKGFTLEQLALMCEVHNETASGWLNAWPTRPSLTAAARLMPHSKPNCSTFCRIRRLT
jgi:hypothetical protein